MLLPALRFRFPLGFVVRLVAGQLATGLLHEGRQFRAKMIAMNITAEMKVFILGGAGISAESGIQTFRDANGLWEEHRVEDVASPEGWARDRELVWRFYSRRREQVLTCKPNPAHETLAQLEDYLGENLFLCTQNIDPLHEAAGNKRVIHMHGELLKSRCADESCPKPAFYDEKLYLSESEIPNCECGASIRPHIVWFGEMPFAMREIQNAVRACDLFITIGSSGAVYPAAGLVREIVYRKEMGENTRSVYIGLERPDNVERFDEVILGKAGEILPTLFCLD